MECGATEYFVLEVERPTDFEPSDNEGMVVVREGSILCEEGAKGGPSVTIYEYPRERRDPNKKKNQSMLQGINVANRGWGLL